MLELTWENCEFTGLCSLRVHLSRYATGVSHPPPTTKTMHLGFGLEKTVVAVTGAGGQIATSIIEAFLEAGCYIAALEINRAKFKNGGDDDRVLWLYADTTDENAVQEAWQAAKDRFGAWPSVCICAAALDLSFVPHHRSITTMSTEQFRRTMDVNVTGTFIAARSWLQHIAPTGHSKSNGTNGMANGANGTVNGSTDEETDSNRSETMAAANDNVSLIIIGSEAGALGVAGNADYAASKSAVQYGLVQSLAPDAARIHPRARVNAICPGAVDTPAFQSECTSDVSGMTQWVEAEATTASRRPTRAEDVARLCLVLASDRWSASTNAQAIRVDAGKSGRLYWGKDGEALW